MRRLWAKIKSFVGRDAAEIELSREIETHLAMLTDEFERRGLSPAEAKRAARRAFGNVESSKELHREARGVPWLEQSLRDVRFGVRSLLRAPGFTAVAVLTLALGIGANVALFSVVNAVLLRPLAYENPGRLVTLLHGGESPVAPGNFVDWRRHLASFEEMGAAEAWSPTLAGGDRPERVRGHRMTRDLMPLLGVEPLHGRWFTPGDDSAASYEVILGYGLWQRRFGSDPDAVGRSISLSGEAHTVVGVMPKEFEFAPFWSADGELWVPIDFGDRVLSRSGNSLRAFGRLAPGVTLDAARAEVAALTDRLERESPGTNRDVRVTPLRDNVVGSVETPLQILWGAVGFVLLIACSNVAHLLLARTSGRRAELAVRNALGAGKARLLRQLLVENLCLATLGAAAGLALARLGLKALVAASPAGLPRVDTADIDGPAFLFLLGLTVLTTVLVGTPPALYASRTHAGDALREGGRGGGAGKRSSRWRGALVASEIMLAFVLLTAAGLMVRSFIALRSIDPGFDPSGVLSMVVTVEESVRADPRDRSAYYRELLERVEAVPGVASASATNHLPLAGDVWGFPFRIEGREALPPGESLRAVFRVSMPGYFETMRLDAVRGRTFDSRDDARSPGVAIINEKAAEVHWAGEDPVGQRVTLASGDDGEPIWLTIVGVVRDAKQYDWASEPQPAIYQSALQNRRYLEEPRTYMTLVVRTEHDPRKATAAVRDAVWSVDPATPISDIQTMEQVVADATAQPRFEMRLFSVFALIALALAMVGIYGVISYSVSRRSREIGIRTALGADRGSLLRLVVGQALVQGAAGITAGVAAALLLSRLLADLLYGIEPTDPATFTATAVILAAVALLAAWLPARRAARTNPIRALAEE